MSSDDSGEGGAGVSRRDFVKEIGRASCRERVYCEV